MARRPVRGRGEGVRADEGRAEERRGGSPDSAAELARLRGLLASTLRELEAMRALLP
jgi:hypothetical protein